MLGMLIMSCIRGLRPFWQNMYVQYAVAAVNNMAFNVEKCVFTIIKDRHTDILHKFLGYLTEEEMVEAWF
jgi:hypothetical protein